ncbi:hypothetical protein [Luteolibacter marinus]|uniref:hypothetical protein n=1 Tax=Luteolibacter marinus TaxID=2776705 RepID=UPI0018665979|nr:hypothetical protein [Luteolibacter marinus]
MKSNTPLLVSLASAILSVVPAQATVPENYITVNAKVSYQQGEIYSGSNARAVGGTVKGVLGTLRISTKDLLKVLADDLAITLPKGARFLHYNGGTFLTASAKGDPNTMWIVDKDGNTIANVSSYFNLYFNLYSLIYEGKYNFENGDENTKNRFPFEIMFDYYIYGGSPALQARGSSSSMGVYLQGNGVIKEDFHAKQKDFEYKASNTGKGDGYVVGYVGDNVKRGLEGANAMGYFSIRFNGEQVYFDE